eukprot:PhF_6_TR15920/c1_g1_i1/m.24621
MGDRFIATWNAVRPVGTHRTASLQAYFAASTTLTTTQQMTVTFGGSSGDVVCGNMGCDGMKKYTVLGKCASFACILERCNRMYDTTCLIDSAMEEEARNNFILSQIDVLNV